MSEKTEWTRLWDMHSGGGAKEGFEVCFIEAPEEEAKLIFYNRFGHNPERVTCTCCGADYSISTHDSLCEATAYHRGAELDTDEDKPATREFVSEKYRTLDAYVQEDGVMVIYAKDIKPEEREGTLPEQGYVWRD